MAVKRGKPQSTPELTSIKAQKPAVLEFYGDVATYHSWLKLHAGRKLCCARFTDRCMVLRY